LYSFEKKDYRERKRNRSEELNDEVGVVSFKEFRGDFRVY